MWAFGNVQGVALVVNHATGCVSQGGTELVGQNPCNAPAHLHLPTNVAGNSLTCVCDGRFHRGSTHMQPQCFHKCRLQFTNIQVHHHSKKCSLISLYNCC